jgi:hypothetical protein
MSSVEPRSPGWSHKSAFETDLALEEAQKWIEDVTGQKFKSPRFKTSLQDGVLLCRYVSVMVSIDFMFSGTRRHVLRDNLSRNEQSYALTG